MANRYTKAKPNMERLIFLYKSGMTQCEVGKEMNISQKIVWRCLRDVKFKCRKDAARNQKGENNNNWKGDGAKYHAFHRRLDVKFGKKYKCQICEEKKDKLDWANINGKYEDENDYLIMCKKCHARHDKSKKYEYIRTKAKVLLDIQWDRRVRKSNRTSI